MSRKFLVPVVLPADPAAAMEAATKQYVDGKLVSGGSLPTGGTANQLLAKISSTNFDTNWITPSWLPLAGGTLSGALQVNSTFGATGAASLGSTLAVTGAATVGGLVLPNNNSISWSSWFNGNIWMQDASWLRIASGVYMATGTLATDGVVTIKNGGAAAQNMALDVNGASYFRNTINFSQANPLLSAPSYITIPNGLYVSGGTNYSGAVIMARGSIQNDSGTYAPALRILGSGANYANGWTNGTQTHFEDTSGAQHSAICFYTGPSAPIIRSYGPFGDRIDHLNNPNTAYCVICASAFTVQSSERIKHDIAALGDDDLLDTMADVRTHRFELNTPPMSIPLSDRFMDLNRRWLAHGKRPLMPTAKCFDGPAEPHDCANERHQCFGAPGHPCPITLNSGPRFGLIAEHLHDHLPEAVSYGEDERPEGYDVDQVAAMAFGGVGALFRKVEALQARIDELEQQHSLQPLGVAA